MNKFRYYIDYGTGYILSSPVANSLKLSKNNELNNISPAIYWLNISGSIMFVGTDYTNILDYKNLGNNYMNMKIQQQVSSLWYDVWEGNCDIISTYDQNRKSIIINNFNNSFDNYHNIINNWETKYVFPNVCGIGHDVMTNGITSEIIVAITVPTTLTFSDYKTRFNIEGKSLLNNESDDRWNYFIYMGQNPDTSYNAQTMSLRLKPSTGYGYSQVKFQGETYFFKLPVGFYTETVYYRITTGCTIENLLNNLIGKIDSLYTFSLSTGISHAGLNDFLSRIIISEQSVVVNGQTTNSVMSLEYLLTLIKSAFNLFWYMDGNSLKFKHSTELKNTSYYNYIAESNDMKILTYIDIPDTEQFKTNDTSGVFYISGTLNNNFGILEIYYRKDKFDLAKIGKKFNSIDIYTNLGIMLRGGNIAKDKFAMFLCNDSTSDPRIIVGTYPEFNDQLSISGLYKWLNAWRFGLSPALANGTKILWVELEDTVPRPFEKEIEFNVPEFRIDTFDTSFMIKTAIGDSFLTNFTIDLSNNKYSINCKLWP